GGNSLEADVYADKVGADAIRYLYGSANPTNDMRFGMPLTDEARRKLIAFWNIYTFFNTYACIDNPDIANYKLDEKNLQITDKWLLQSINEFVEKSDKNYAEFNNFLVVKDFEKLVDDISNFYIRVNRKRFWKSEEKEDQMTAYWCLYYAIKKLIQVMTPIIPFLCEYIWQSGVREIEKDEAESIMLAGFACKINCSDFSDVSKDVDVARQIITLAQRLRNENQIKIKQPLKTLFVVGNADAKKATQSLNDIITSELNIKQVLFETDNSKFNDEYLGVDFKKAGAVLKGEVQRLKTTLAEIDDDTMAKAVLDYKSGCVNVGDFRGLASEIFTLQSKPKSEFVIIQDGGITVVLDTTIDETLMLEGLFREVVRSAQMLRKEANFRIEQRILINVTSESEDVNKMLSMFKSKLMEDVLAKDFGNISNPDIVKTIEIAGENVKFELKALD
ncbi:MAG: class I tRNA ligase family protein, partial [Clostridia bacterium]|nr:class I tRNA ligase family protein [Clostridia bacterium]